MEKETNLNAEYSTVSKILAAALTDLKNAGVSEIVALSEAERTETASKMNRNDRQSFKPTAVGNSAVGNSASVTQSSFADNSTSSVPGASSDNGTSVKPAPYRPAPSLSSKDQPAMKKSESTPPTQSPGTPPCKKQLLELSQQVAQCTLCHELVANRTRTVFGDGNPSSQLVFIGEGPGADEDRMGLPFVGRSGQLLTDIITKGMKLRREDVYICNIVRCRPPGNRNPLPVEAENCRPFLLATLNIIKPKFICCLGAVAATNLLQTEQQIGKLRGKIHQWNDCQVVCTYHPAYLLRNPSAKAQTWEDIKLLMTAMNLPIN